MQNETEKVPVDTRWVEPETTEETLPETEPKVVAADDEEAEEGTEESTTSTDAPDDATHRKNKGVGKRINELTREKYEAVRKAEQLAQEVDFLRQQVAQPPPSTEKPTLESCNFDVEEHAEKMADWKFNQRELERDSRAHQNAMTQHVQQVKAKFEERVQEFEERLPGAWERAVNAPMRTTDAMLEVIAESPVGPELAHYLAEHLDEADAISRMSNARAASALGKLEAKIEANPLGIPPAKSITSAPKPAPAIAAKGTVNKDPSRMTMKEYCAWRNSQKT